MPYSANVAAMWKTVATNLKTSLAVNLNQWLGGQALFRVIATEAV